MALTEIPVELSSTPGIVDSSNATAITIDSSENVGIGDTVPAWGTPYTALTIGSSGSIWASKAGTSLTVIADNSYFNGSNYIARNTQAGTDYTQSTGNHTFSSAPSVSAGATQTFTTKMKIDADGHVTMPLQPAFSVVSNADNTNIPTDAVGVVVNFGSTPIYDQNSDFTTGTKLFTAPVTGKYQLSTNLYVNTIDAAAQYIRLSINTSNRLYSQLHDPRGLDQDVVRGNFNYSILADMDAGDTAKVEISQYEGTAQMDVMASELTIFTGVLVC